MADDNILMATERYEYYMVSPTHEEYQPSKHRTLAQHTCYFARCGAQHSVTAALCDYPPKMLEFPNHFGCVSKTWSFSTVCENLRWKCPLTAEKSFSEKVNF